MDIPITDCLPPDELATIAQMAAGLLMPSETDAPFIPFRWPGDDPITEESLRATLGIPADMPIATRDVKTFFCPLVTAQSWDSDEDTARRARFQALKTALLQLTDVKIYRIGEIAITTLLIGRDHTGALVGLRTKQVET